MKLVTNDRHRGKASEGGCREGNAEEDIDGRVKVDVVKDMSR